MSLHHSGESCNGCLGMLGSVHQIMAQFFLWAKDLHPDLHIAQGWRGQEDQDRAYNLGKSKLKWPDSKHNKLDQDGDPCSEALDLFTLDLDGKAQFDIKFYQELYNEIKAADLNIVWGGSWEHFKDNDHFELGGLHATV